MYLEEAKTGVSWVQRTVWIINTLYNQVLGMEIILLFWLFIEHYSGLYFWHLFLSTIAYIPLMAAAIILFSEDNHWSQHMQRTNKYWIHGVLLTISFVAVTFGIFAEFYYKSKDNKAHFTTSNHAILGLVSWILTVLAFVIVLLAANTKIFSSFVKPVIAKLIHNILGIAGFAIGMGSLYGGLGIINDNVSENAYIACQWAHWFITFWSLLAAFKSLYGQIKSVFF